MGCDPAGAHNGSIKECTRCDVTCGKPNSLLDVGMPTYLYTYHISLHCDVNNVLKY